MLHVSETWPAIKREHSSDDKHLNCWPLAPAPGVCLMHLALGCTASPGKSAAAADDVRRQHVPRGLEQLPSAQPTEQRVVLAVPASLFSGHAYMVTDTSRDPVFHHIICRGRCRIKHVDVSSHDDLARCSIMNAVGATTHIMQEYQESSTLDIDMLSFSRTSTSSDLPFHE